MQEFKERLLATGGSRIIDKMIAVALDDSHPGQMAAIKLSVERLLPLSMFEAAKGGSGTGGVVINISTMGETPKAEVVADVTDVQVRTLDD